VRTFSWPVTRPITAARGHGFTLIELMVAIAVVSILLTLAVPSMRTFIVDNGISARTNDLVASLALARSEAAKRGVSAGVCASTDGTTCGSAATWSDGWLVYADSNNSGAMNSGDEVIKVETALSSGMTLTNGSSVTAVQYGPNGTPSVIAGTNFTLCKSGYKGRTIAISPSGRASSSKTSANCS
jgi:type IV fimbrial biogenesis protein FimT